jgi:hypothetical protein
MIRIAVIAGLLVPCIFLLSDRSEPRGIGAAVPVATPEKERCKPCRRPDSDKANESPNVNDLALNKLELKAECPGTSPTDYSRMSVEVESIAEDPEGDVLTYNYTITGGRIVGTGKKIHWNLTGVKPGTYTILAGVDDGCGICGRTVTKTVTVAECDAIR